MPAKVIARRKHSTKAIDSLSTPLTTIGEPLLLNSEETAALQRKLWPLLVRQFRLKTQGDSTSLREEEATELLDSIMFTLRFYLGEKGLPDRTLLSSDIPAIFTAAQESVKDCFTETESLYRQAMQQVNDFGSQSLRDTLNGMGLFFRMYDYRLYAHQIPAEIDYQLCLSIPDSLRGVAYLREYLRRLLTENKLLTRFSPSRVYSLLAHSCKEYRDLLVNLYEPVAAVVIGHSLLGGGETLLELTPAQARQIYVSMAALPPADAQAQLESAAHTACQRLGFADDFSVLYLSQTASALYPRLVAAPQSAVGVFSVAPVQKP